jgi:transcriptional regulator with XRE-family HTH domain
MTCLQHGPYGARSHSLSYRQKPPPILLEVVLSLGKNIKLRRVELGMPAKELAERVGVSPSYISKIESDTLSPSLELLSKLVKELDVSYGELLMGPSPTARTDPSSDYVAVVRAEDRMTVRIPARDVIYEILTPDLQGDYEFVLIHQEPHEGGEEFFAHEEGRESVLVLEGTLRVDVRETTYQLGVGDCLTLDATLPHRYLNEADERATWIFIACPPSL